MAVSQSFFVAFLEETLQKSSGDCVFVSKPLIASSEDTFETIKLVCTKVCHIIFNDASPQLMKKDDRNLLIVTKVPGFYSVYKNNEILFRAKNQKVS